MTLPNKAAWRGDAPLPPESAGNRYQYTALVPEPRYRGTNCVPPVPMAHLPTSCGAPPPCVVAAGGGGGGGEEGR